MRPLTRHTMRLERGLGPFAHPAFAAILYVATMWCWHVPALYDAALAHSTVHVLEHLASHRRLPVLVAPARPDPLAACASAAWRRSPTWSAPSSPSACSASA